MQSTNEKLTEVALTMLLKVFREVQCDLFNVMTVGNIETKGNKMANYLDFLYVKSTKLRYPKFCHEGFIMKVFELIKAANIVSI